MKTIIIQTTCKTKKEAKKIAKILLRDKLAACVQITNIKSFYTWKNKLCKDNEKLISIKTKKKHFIKIKRQIKEIHSYHLPEIIAIDITKISEKYLKYIGENTK